MCTLDQSLVQRYTEGLIKRSDAVDRAQDLKEMTKLLMNIDQRRGVAH
jgi:hypothetical protein